MAEYLQIPRAEPIALSVLGLDLPTPPLGWRSYLEQRGIQVVEDELGREAVHRSDAKRLIVEERERQQQARELALRAEMEAERRDREWRLQLPRGTSWLDIPDGVQPAAAMLQHAKDSQPRTVPSQMEWMFGTADTMVYHEFPAEDEPA
jgi:hypothetical protein